MEHTALPNKMSTPSGRRNEKKRSLVAADILFQSIPKKKIGISKTPGPITSNEKSKEVCEAKLPPPGPSGKSKDKQTRSGRSKERSAVKRVGKEQAIPLDLVKK